MYEYFICLVVNKSYSQVSNPILLGETLSFHYPEDAPNIDPLPHFNFDPVAQLNFDPLPHFNLGPVVNSPYLK
jgi:hypothetical protein